MAKIDIISGFLGAGKTTLIRKLLADAFKGQQVVLIENEFGEIGIDGGFLKNAGIEIKEMNSGCICCSLVGDFGTALKDVVDQYHPDRVIIEPSGVGKLSDVIRAVDKNADAADLELNSATTVVDVTKCKMYLKNFGEFFKNQVEAAGTIILSRTDTPKATPEKIQEALDLLRAINPTATIITTPVETLSGKKVLETMEGVKIDLTLLDDEDEDEDEHEHHHHHHDHDDEDEHEHHHHHHDDDDDDDEDEHEHHHHYDENGVCSCGHHHHHHHGHDADEVFTSWGRETIRKYTVEEINAILEALSADNTYGIILRAKGMVPAEDGTWIYFDMVPEEADVRSGDPEYTGRLCVIGSELKEDKLEELFKLA
ncbi:MAG: CobW family GTP-binding protein [Eubacterium sp.]|nr:CobW family GTP-binding protein [Eubacterium sp.]